MSSQPGVSSRSTANPTMEPVGNTGSCADRYNGLLMKAKAALAAGDRAATVNLLKRARELIRSCPALQEGNSPGSLLLSFLEPPDNRVEPRGLRPVCSFA